MRIITILLFLVLVFTAIYAKGLLTTGTFTPIPLSLTIDDPYPVNNSVDVALNVTLNITCTSQEGYTMNLSWYENTSGSWLLVQQNLSINNGTFSYGFVNSSNYSTEYCWKVSANDGMGNINNKTFCFTTEANVSTITITNVYPVNDSRNIPIQPVCYATVNHTNGITMNISWYFGTSSGNENVLLGTDNNVSNSTQNILCYPASDRSTTYYWKIVVNDGQGHWQNESFSFTTEGSSSVMSSSNSVYGIIGVLGFLGIIGFILMRRRKKEDEYR